TCSVARPSTSASGNPEGRGMSEGERLFEGGSVTVTGLKVEYGIGRSVAYELMSAGRLAFTTVGRRLIPRSAVVKLLAEGLQGLIQDGRAVATGLTRNATRPRWHRGRV